VSNLRKQRLSSVLYAIQAIDGFSSESARSQCRDVSPGYVTRLINQLTREGHLEKLVENQQSIYRWSKSKPLDPAHWIERQVHGEQIKQSPEQDRPREKLLIGGAASLTDSQLIAILIRVGVPGDSAVQAATRIANRFQSDALANLPDASLSELRLISKAIRRDSYAQIMAGIELGRRIARIKDENSLPVERIRGSDDAIRYCMRIFQRLALDGKQEEFHIVTLDTQLGPISTHHITTGTLDASLVHPREVFRAAIRDSASAVLLVHNHPSGDPTPSREDKSVTDRLSKVGEIIGIRVIDHIIVARERGRSVLESM
jgi:DNA repair protein RadC